MKISVVIPAYNEEKVLGQCLRALKNQIVPVYEIIVVNNNSSDKTESIAESFKVKVIRESRQGITFARNSGFDCVTGEVIGRIDADTILPLDWTQKITVAFSNPSVVGVSGPVVFHDFFGGKMIGKVLGWLHKFLYFDISRALIGHNVLFGSNMAIRKNAWTQIKSGLCNDERKYHEDMDLSVHISSLGIVLFEPKLCALISSRRILKPHTFLNYLMRQVKSILHAKK